MRLLQALLGFGISCLMMGRLVQWFLREGPSARLLAESKSDRSRRLELR